MLTVTKAGTGAGTVTSSPAGINCGATCSASFAPGSVQLTATPNAGSTFAGFSGGGCGATSPCTVSLSANTTVTATFNDTQAPTAPTSLTATPISVSQINLFWTASTDNMAVAGYWIERCLASSCTYARVNGALVTGTTYNDTTGLTAGTAYNYRVQAVDAVPNPSAYSTVATASTFATLTLSKAGSGAGLVTSSPAGINCGATCSASFASGTSITLTAAPTNSIFDGYSGGCTGTTTSCTFTITANTTVTATFTNAGQLAGTITRSTDSAPLSGALVEALQAGQVKASATTPSNGNYLLGPIPVGSYDLRISEAGYVTAQQNGLSVTGGSTVTTNVVLTPTDTTPPAVTITFPGDQAQLTVKTITVSGTLDDPTATVTVNGVTADVSSGLYSAAGVTLPPGANDITIRAVDPFGNVTTQLRHVFLENIPPVVQITAPAAGVVLSVPTLTVTGTIDDPTAPVTVNGVTATVNGNQFTVTNLPAPEGALVLTARAEDPAGNVGTDARTVTVDRTPPTVTLSVPSETAAGRNLAIHLEATDNLGLREIALSIGGKAAASFSSSPADFTYTVPPDTPVGTVLSLLGQAVDAAGLTQGQGGSVLVNVPTQAPGFAQGRVLDDAMGLPLSAVTVTLDADTQLSDAEGTYLFNRTGGTIRLSFEKAGYTDAERSGDLPAGQKVTLLDARLTPIDSRDNLIGAAGGRGSNQAGTLFLEVPSGALAAQRSIRITEISNQGLIDRLPLGWSPVSAVDLRVAGDDTVYTLNGVLTFPNRLNLAAGSSVVAAKYDRSSHAWRAISPGTVPVDGKGVNLSVLQTGQYLLLVADAGATAPPAPVVNALLQGASASSIPNLQVSGSVIPKATVPGGPMQAVGEVVVLTDQPVASGLRLSAKVAEQFDLRDQTQQLADFGQDLIVYQWPPSSSASTPPAARLSTKFPITPSKTFTLTELALGKVTVDFTLPPQDRAGSLVGTAGGTLNGSDGLLVSIPAGSLSAETLAKVEGVTISSFALPTGWTLVRSVLLDLTQAQLTQSAQISLPTPAGLAPNRPILIGRVTNIQGERGLKLVAFGKISGNLLVSAPTLYGTTLPGIRQGGEYLLIQPTGDIGFVGGVVSGAGGSPKSGVRVKGPEGPFFDSPLPTGSIGLPSSSGAVRLRRRISPARNRRRRR